MQRARRPICLCPEQTPWGIFEAETEDELFAMIANHTISMHHGGPINAYWAASVAMPMTAARYQQQCGHKHP
jgi:hypothetical protein